MKLSPELKYCWFPHKQKIGDHIIETRFMRGAWVVRIYNGAGRRVFTRRENGFTFLLARATGTIVAEQLTSLQTE